MHASHSLLQQALTFIQMLSSNRARRMSSSGVSCDQPPYNSMSAAVIAVNDDLLIKILLCLPVRSLLVFKSVSKKWLSLISDPSFVQNHGLQTHPLPIPGLFLYKLSYSEDSEFDFIFLDEQVTGVPFESLTFVNDPEGINVKQSCNGLLLCCDSIELSDDPSYYIYNPATNQCTTLPASPNRETGPNSTLFGSEIYDEASVPILSISLAFDPLKSPYYKAICVLHNESDLFRIEIYSSETSSWRLSGDAFEACYDLFVESGVYWNGSLHWMSYKEDSLYFDVDREVMKTMPMPPRPDGSTSGGLWYFGAYRDHMYVTRIFNPPTTKFDIYEMETDYSIWNVKYHVDLDAVIVSYPEIIMDYREVTDPFYFKFYLLHIVEEEELSLLVLQIPDKILSYNLKDMTCKEILVLSADLDLKDSYDRCEVHQYIETLACV